MKKGDIIAREIRHPVGEVLGYNFSTEMKVKDFMETEMVKRFSRVPKYRVGLDPINEGKLSPVLEEEVVEYEEATVNWVVEKEVAIQLKDGTARIINLDEEPEWRVIWESAPSYQSTVAQMSDEELRASIDALRRMRASAPKPGVRARGQGVSRDPIEIALSKMPPEKKMELMKKLGMVDDG